MADLNPYKALRHAERPPDRRTLRPAIGGGIMLLLTPLAVLVAIAGTCSVTAYEPPELSLPILIAGPLIVISVLMALAAVRDRVSGEGDRGRNRLGVLIATPFVVAIATGVGFVLGIVAFDILSRSTVVFDAEAGIAGVAIAYVVPFAVLVAMLYGAWRVGL